MHRADVSDVVNACDAGREGELVFRFVYGVAGCKKPMRRLWISSMEESAIKAGFASLKDGQEYEYLYSSALYRAKADWIIGINATRLFSCLYGKPASFFSSFSTAFGSSALIPPSPVLRILSSKPCISCHSR